MRVLLLKDVARLGQRGDIKDVKPGYAQNFLLARGLAKPASDRAIQESAHIRAEREAERHALDHEFENTLAALGGKTISLEAKATTQGNLYRGIGKKQILAALTDAGIAGIREDDIASEPLKKLGAHTITLKRGAHAGTFVLTITAKK